MKRRGEKFWRVWLASLLWTALIIPCLVLAQTDQDKKKKQEEVDTPYTEEEFAAYEAATKEPDLVKRQQMMIKFMTDNPKSELNKYVVPVYQQLLRDYFDKSQYAPLAAAAEAYLAFDPKDLLSIAMAAEGYRNLGDHAKYVEYGQKVFANVSSGGDAYNLTKAFEALKDDDRYMEWAQKTLELLPDTVPANYPIQMELLSRLRQMYAERKQIAKAAVLAQKLVPILEKSQKPEKATAAEWQKYISKEKANAWSIIGESHYDKEKWREAMTAYQKSISFIRKNDLAYYRIGLCSWKLDDVDSAIDNFARAYVLKGSMAKLAYGYLEHLYKALHNGTTVGINKVLDQARREMEG